MKRLVTWIGICLLGASMLYAAPAKADDFQEANTAYRTGDYVKAAALYEKSIGRDPHVAAYYYNLGNAAVRSGRLSTAILSYEKALILDPRNEDIRHNLKYARGLLEYRVEDSRNWYVRAVGAALRYVTQREVYTLLFVTAFVFLLSGIVYFLSGRGLFWNAWRKFVFVLLLLAGLIVFGKHVQDDLYRDAIVMQKECEARYGPSEHDQVAFRMGEGIKVFVMDHREDWSRVLLTNGESGWVKSSDLVEVKI